MLLYNINMIEEINNIVANLESSNNGDEAVQVSGLSSADVEAIRSSPLWQLRDKLLGGGCKGITTDE